MSRYELVRMVRHVDGAVFFDDTITGDNYEYLKEEAEHYYNRYNKHPLYAYVMVGIFDNDVDDYLPSAYWESK